MSSEMPKDKEPIKSLRDVRSQSQASRESRFEWSSPESSLPMMAGKMLKKINHHGTSFNNHSAES